MDITTLIGIVVGTFLVINGIGTDKLGNFVDKSSILIVVGGTLAATVASYPLSILMDIPKHIMVLFRGKQYNIPKLVEQLVDLAMIARQSGLLALEEKADEIKDPFFRQSVLMIVDANDPDKVRFVLERELENMMTRHDEVAGLYEKASAYAPAFGMIGTLVGLINMLKGLNLDDGGSHKFGTGYVGGPDYHLLRKRAFQPDFPSHCKETAHTPGRGGTILFHHHRRNHCNPVRRESQVLKGASSGLHQAVPAEKASVKGRSRQRQGRRCRQ